MDERTKRRIVSRVDKSGKHWLYGSWKTRCPMLHIRGKRFAVARVLWKISGKTLNKTDSLVQTCNCLACVNPKHFKKLTQKQFYRFMQKRQQARRK